MADKHFRHIQETETAMFTKFKVLDSKIWQRFMDTLKTENKKIRTENMLHIGTYPQESSLTHFMPNDLIKGHTCKQVE